ELFHFSLRTGGVLVLGNSETIGRQTALFETVSKKHRIYRTRVITRASRYRATPWFAERAQVRAPTDVPVALHKAPKAARLIAQLCLSRSTRACVAINANYEILSVFGPTHDYLVQPTGEVRLDFLSWARPGLFPKLRFALREAIEQKHRVTISDLRV